MARAFSVYRRRPHYVDLLLPFDSTILTWEFQAAQYFDGSYTTFATVGGNGFRSPGIFTSDYVDSQFRGKVRFVFDPDYFTVTNGDVVDDDTFWVKVITTTRAGVVSGASGAQPIMPYYAIPYRTFILQGTAYDASEPDAQEIQLPQLCKNFNIQNNGSVDILVKFEPSGDEFNIKPVSTDGVDFMTVSQTISQVYVRGDGGNADFRASFEIHNQED